MLKIMISHIDNLDSQITALDKKVEHRLLPIQDKVDLVDSIPGIAKRRNGRTRKGNDMLKTTLIECSKSASHQKSTYFYAQYHRSTSRRGKTELLLQSHILC